MRRENPTFICDNPACAVERAGAPWEDEGGTTKEGVPRGWVVLSEATIIDQEPLLSGPPKKLKRKHACSAECAAEILSAAGAFEYREDERGALATS